MQDRKYLLSIQELLQAEAEMPEASKKDEACERREICKKDETCERHEACEKDEACKKHEVCEKDETCEKAALWQQACTLLDEERLRKIHKLKNGRKCAESIGAGLLLQLAVWEMQKQEKTEDDKAVKDKSVKDKLVENKAERRTADITEVTFSQIFQIVKRPLQLEYTYSEYGKPYFKDIPYYFSISHSGEYVFLVISKQEVGADIQFMEPEVNERLLQRFFSQKEKNNYEQCENGEERRLLFYQLWCRKEAYAKLTGEGIPAVIGRDMSDEALNAKKKEHDTKESTHICVNDMGNKDGKDSGTGRHITVEEYQVMKDCQEAEKYQIAVCKWK